MDRSPVIEVDGVTKVYDLGEQKVEALKGVSLTIFQGEIVALMGPSGSGKSTFMNLLGFLDRPSTGNYRLNGEDVGALSSDDMAWVRNHEIGFVFQNYNLLARTTSVENAELPALYNGTSSAAGRRKAREVLALVGLSERETHRPTQLSGGQQQRVAIARALLNDPRIILADEPTGNLDTRTGAEIIELFKTLNREKGITIVFVTHDPEVASHGQRIIHFKDGLVEREEAGGKAGFGAVTASPEEDAGASGEGVGAGAANDVLDLGDSGNGNGVSDGEDARNGSGARNGNGGDNGNGGGRRRRGLGAGVRANVRIALRAIRVNKLRSALTMLGVIIGVGAVIAMVAIGEGAKARVAKQMERLGSNRVSVYAGAVTRGGRRVRGARITTLTEADAKAILAEVPGVVRVAPHVRGSAQVVYGNKNWHPGFTGTTPDYLEIMNWGVDSGSNFTEDDMLLNRKVALIGQTVAKELFGDEYPLGQTIRLKHVPFEVVGVLKERGTSSFAGDLDDVVIVPLRTAQRKLLGIRYVRGIEVSAESKQATSDVQDGITALLRVRHKITGTKLDDFRVRNRTDIVEAANEAANTLGYLLAGIAGVALIVGGIGIMNIMLVSVTERTREIGVRLAVGARRRDIRRQFLTEAMVLSLLGGAVGILAGAAASLGLSYMGGWQIVISPGSILLAFAFAAAIGVFFGFQPANRAARLNPIEALRYE
ncbi:MAG: ABC transporter permease [Deltaproteobacteria bacterium]|nr:ABC transporter permease [Deltaproteobacteria bacterium]